MNTGCNLIREQLKKKDKDDLEKDKETKAQSSFFTLNLKISF